MARDRFYERLAPGGRRAAPSAARNSEPIMAVLQEWLPAAGLVLEIASGTGEHAVGFARRFPALDWQPSDADPVALASIEAWVADAGLPNLREPIILDVTDQPWPVHRAEAVLSINMVHISPWAASLGLLDGAARALTEGAPLVLYGPWIVEGQETAPSNLAFDADLRRRDPAWGLRRVGEFAEVAKARGLMLEASHAMPANNLMLLFRRSA